MPPHLPILMREDERLATVHRHHRRKIALFFAAMRAFASDLRLSGREVRYRRWGEADGCDGVFDMLARSGAGRVWLHEPSDRRFAGELTAWGASADVELRLLPSPKFLTSREEWERWRRRSERLLMGDFYAYQRRRLGLLVGPGGEPLGGRWSHDAENRRPLPREVLPPPAYGFPPDPETRAVIALVDREFPDHPGRAEGFEYATTHADAAAWLETFVEERLERFGPYEDAIPSRERVLFHGVLTPYLNCGLLTPAQVVEAALRRNALAPIAINSLEGFLRQVVGWREFVRWVDHDLYAERGWGEAEPWPNALGATRRLGPEWWSAETGLPPLDTVIRRAAEHGWTHHIERLMVAGAAMTMAGVAPTEQYRWFMEMYVDSAEWVMAPNVFGMTSFADSGLFTTKPYISGSAYLLRMGDHPRGAWCDVWDGLYWGFVRRHRDLFAANPRTSAATAGYERLDPLRRDRILAAAEAFVARTTLHGSSGQKSLEG